MKSLPGREQFFSAFKSGVIAVVGSMPQEVLDQFGAHPKGLESLLSLVFNEVAVFACGAIVPYELDKDVTKLRAATVDAMNDGKMAKAPKSNAKEGEEVHSRPGRYRGRDVGGR
jgi:hypothetical protein